MLISSFIKKNIAWEFLLHIFIDYSCIFVRLLLQANTISLCMFPTNTYYRVTPTTCCPLLRANNLCANELSPDFRQYLAKTTSCPIFVAINYLLSPHLLFDVSDCAPILFISLQLFVPCPKMWMM